MDPVLLHKIKKLAIIAMFSDDELLDRLVLKGGNALDIVHKIAARSSLDLDFSMDGGFGPDELKQVVDRVTRRLIEVFTAEHFHVFDIFLSEKPPMVSSDMADFWGGYEIEFKVATEDLLGEASGDLETLRKRAIEMNRQHHRKFRIQISKFELCSPKIEAELDGYTVYVYTPAMIVFEKLRAICQQMREYEHVVQAPSRSARARDFFDIYTVLESCEVDVTSANAKRLLTSVFEAKRVPLKFLGFLEEYRDFHRPDFESVRDTVKPDANLQDYDFYFDYVLSLTRELESLWDE